MGFGLFRQAVLRCAPLLLLSLVAAKPQPRVLQAGGGAAPPSGSHLLGVALVAAALAAALGAVGGRGAALGALAVLGGRGGRAR